MVRTFWLIVAQDRVYQAAGLLVKSSKLYMQYWTKGSRRVEQVFEAILYLSGQQSCTSFESVLCAYICLQL